MTQKSRITEDVSVYVCVRVWVRVCGCASVYERASAHVGDVCTQAFVKKRASEHDGKRKRE